MKQENKSRYSHSIPIHTGLGSSHFSFPPQRESSLYQSPGLPQHEIKGWALQNIFPPKSTATVGLKIEQL